MLSILFYNANMLGSFIICISYNILNSEGSKKTWQDETLEKYNVVQSAQWSIVYLSIFVWS